MTKDKLRALMFEGWDVPIAASVLRLRIRQLTTKQIGQRRKLERLLCRELGLPEPPEVKPGPKKGAPRSSVYKQRSDAGVPNKARGAKRNTQL